MRSKNMDRKNLESWLPLLISFRLILRLLTLVGLPFFLVPMLNISLFSKLSGEFLRAYIIALLVTEVYLLLTFRKGKIPLKSLLTYFGMATIFEFPDTVVRLLFGEFPLHALPFLPLAIPWYLSTLAGLIISLKLFFRKS